MEPNDSIQVNPAEEVATSDAVVPEVGEQGADTPSPAEDVVVE